MKYGFVIDNRKCIGCHACTVACKSEHDVPIGVNRTWVKQVEKGTFPDSRRLFSVMRCNHCTDAPCVEICPVEALYIRPDGIVDFDNDRCIGCKSCMQACPYDVLYIDPNTHTAAKCNYCAHRVDVGLEPACVNVCPEHAIISGDMEDPTTEIAQLLSREAVTVRKPEKGTKPNVFYIDGDLSSLNASATQKSDDYMWNSQTGGVGHYARYAAEKIMDGKSLVEMAAELSGETITPKPAIDVAATQPKKRTIEAVMENAKRVYDAPKKGILWGWEVSTYVWTKAIAAGTFLVTFLAVAFGIAPVEAMTEWAAVGISLLFLAATTVLLVMDLDQPKRFLYVMLRPQWRSWLVKGGYALAIYGGLLTFWLGAKFLQMDALVTAFWWIGAVFGVITAIYTAFLFAQSKGRDFWQSPVLPMHMLIHSFMAGAAILLVLAAAMGGNTEWIAYLKMVLIASTITNLVILWAEITVPHPTDDAKTVVKMITSGMYKNQFWGGTLILGNVIPLVLAFVGGTSIPILAVAGLTALVGIYITEKIWVEAPQQIELN
ncbi:MAG: NrfD/PsrC family molybdoenzyme membrane anchor subunit [Chitinophagales bacterium]